MRFQFTFICIALACLMGASTSLAVADPPPPDPSMEDPETPDLPTFPLPAPETYQQHFCCKHGAWEFGPNGGADCYSAYACGETANCGGFMCAVWRDGGCEDDNQANPPHSCAPTQTVQAIQPVMLSCLEGNCYYHRFDLGLGVWVQENGHYCIVTQVTGVCPSVTPKDCKSLTTCP